MRTFVEALEKEGKVGLVLRGRQPEGTRISVSGVEIGDPGRFIVFAGPCSVENREQILDAAKALKAAGAHVLRGGAYKPTTYPVKFQGLEEEGLTLLDEAKRASGLPVITEVMDPREVEIVGGHTDIFQIGTRNFQNYDLLNEVGRSQTPVFLKRGTWGTVDEVLGAAERILRQGNTQVMLCERGIVGGPTYERVFPTIRWHPDLMIIPALKTLTHLPVIFDASHATGYREFVEPMALAAAAAGADGLMVEVHPEPEKSLTDAPQAIDYKAFGHLMEKLRAVLAAVGRTL